ncbi:Iron-regulated transporter 1 [Hyphodiscus hymeniophilus]|uniref:Solute carrier family 40 member n=1 Tax=Hyphodiscus hymeniophilus TaxID=353542 RepID=A0A9P6VK86_9HELO|nr:Iron-regulated transporter 1 [Hyphodiscus hymeniophilus]
MNLSSSTSEAFDASPTNHPEHNGPSSPLLEDFPFIEEDVLMTRSQALNLYTTHFLSTWNVRSYEFAAIIFTAAAYPDTLVAASIRGIMRAVASICFSSAVGRWVDQNPNRLKTLLSTITVNRSSVIAASAMWFFVVGSNTGNNQNQATGPGSTVNEGLLNGSLFALILLLGILENLSASGNMLSMERDWVVAASSPDGRPYDLTYLNSAMRRIDLICKLIAPIVISVIVSATNVRTGVLVVGGTSAATWVVELWSARRTQISDGLSPLETLHRTPWNQAFQGFRSYTLDIKNYFSSVAWIPSLSLAFLHISALTYSATFITYLLAVGFSLDLITIARAAGSIIEISSTLVTPFGVEILSKARSHGRFRGQDLAERGSEDSNRGLIGEAAEESKTETGLERLGLWGISFQLLNLVPVVFALWHLSPSPVSAAPSSLSNFVSRFLAMPPQRLVAFMLFFFLSISRLGLWIYDLTTQQLTQTMVAPSHRSSFTGVEYSFVAFFELGQYIITVVLHKPDQFKWVASFSWIAVLLSTVAYAGWVWRMRGHLVHWERFGKGCMGTKGEVGGKV